MTRACRGPQDPDPWCQRLAARRQALRQAAQQHLRQVYALDEQQAQHLFAQWSQHYFRQLLTTEAMGQLDLEAALTEELPT